MTTASRDGPSKYAIKSVQLFIFFWDHDSVGLLNQIKILGNMQSMDVFPIQPSTMNTGGSKEALQGGVIKLV